MATPWETLGATLGGGIDREGAYEKGRLHTAQTESALGMARQRQLENTALEEKAKARAGIEESLVKSGVPAEQAQLQARLMAGELGSEYANATQGALRQQEFELRDVLSDPAAPADVQFNAGQGVQGKVLPRYQVDGNVSQDLLGEELGLTATPVGESVIGANQASANASNAAAYLRMTQAGDPDYRTASGGGGGRDGVPSGYKRNPAFDPSRPASPDNPELVPMSGGPNDPNAPYRLGVNALAQFSRVLNAAGNTALDLGNIMAMPSGASSGWFGQPGKNLLSMVPGNLANQVSPAEVQQYRAVIGTLGEQLSTIERMGMRGSQGLSARFDDLQLLPTDDVFTKMYKLAQMRQTVENGMDTLLSLNALQGDMAARAEGLKNTVATAIPFTPRDVLALQESKDPNATLGQMLQQNGAPASPPAPAAPGDAPAAPAGNVERWERGPDRKLRRVQ
jgi:hypothetical protein